MPLRHSAPAALLCGVLGFAGCERQAAPPLPAVELVAPTDTAPVLPSIARVDSLLQTAHVLGDQHAGNELVAYWGDRAVGASVYVSGITPGMAGRVEGDARNLLLPPSAVPYELAIRAPFPGSLWGISIGDTHAQVVAKLAARTDSVVRRPRMDWPDTEVYCAALPVFSDLDVCWWEEVAGHRVNRVAISDRRYTAAPW